MRQPVTAVIGTQAGSLWKPRHHYGQCEERHRSTKGHVRSRRRRLQAPTLIIARMKLIDMPALYEGGESVYNDDEGQKVLGCTAAVNRVRSDQQVGRIELLFAPRVSRANRDGRKIVKTARRETGPKRTEPGNDDVCDGRPTSPRV